MKIIDKRTSSGMEPECFGKCDFQKIECCSCKFQLDCLDKTQDNLADAIVDKVLKEK